MKYDEVEEVILLLRKSHLEGACGERLFSYLSIAIRMLSKLQKEVKNEPSTIQEH